MAQQRELEAAQQAAQHQKLLQQHRILQMQVGTSCRLLELLTYTLSMNTPAKGLVMKNIIDTSCGESICDIICTQSS